MERGEIVRKGPWTENEDVQLNLYVNLFGDRRWDFIAKVSGLKVEGEMSGKSCRLRWVNYLHPGLKRGKMSPQEERLVLELHSKWGNRWSRIARKLPGRTDNEIKNYWRSHMRKKAQEKKMMNLSSSSSSSLSNSSSHSSLSTIPPDYSNSNPILVTETGDRSFYDTGGLEMLVPRGKNNNIFNHQEEEEETQKCNFMMDDEIWDNMGFSELKPGIFEGYDEAVGCPALAASPIWDYCPDSLWMIGDGGGSSSKMHPPVTDQIYDSFYGHESSFLDG